MGIEPCMYIARHRFHPLSSFPSLRRIPLEVPPSHRAREPINKPENIPKILQLCMSAEIPFGIMSRSQVQEQELEECRSGNKWKLYRKSRLLPSLTLSPSVLTVGVQSALFIPCSRFPPHLNMTSHTKQDY